jgi:glycosyltransferase involved in cell wall biosynthesis
VPDLFESGREGLIVQPGDVQGLSNSMVSLLGNREARQSMGMAAAQRARESFDVSTMVRAYEELYENLVDHSHGLSTESTFRESGTPAREMVGSQNR